MADAGPPFAQDEMQVAEHPALASVRGWLTTASLPGLCTVTREVAAATPVLITGAERTRERGNGHRRDRSRRSHV